MYATFRATDFSIDMMLDRADGASPLIHDLDDGRRLFECHGSPSGRVRWDIEEQDVGEQDIIVCCFPKAAAARLPGYHFLFADHGGPVEVRYIVDGADYDIVVSTA